VAAGTCALKARPAGSEKRSAPLSAPALVAAVQEELARVHATLLNTARDRLAASTKPVATFAEMAEAFLRADAAAATQANGEAGGGGEASGSGGSTEHLGFFLAPWFDDAAAEAAIKEKTRATVRCFPLGLQHQAAGRACFYSGKPATHMAIFARAF